MRLRAGSCVSTLRLDDAEKALRRGLVCLNGVGAPSPTPRHTALQCFLH
jgi:hypothetical protein